MDWLEAAAQITVILSFIGGVLGAIFNFVVVKPLRMSIDSLSVAVSKLGEEFNDSKQRLNKLEATVERVEHAVTYAHNRIDGLGRDSNARRD